MKLIPSSCHSQCHVYVLGQIDIHFDAMKNKSIITVTEVTRSRVQCLLKCPHSTVLHNKQKNIRISERKR